MVKHYVMWPNHTFETINHRFQRNAKFQAKSFAPAHPIIFSLSIGQEATEIVCYWIFIGY